MLDKKKKKKKSTTTTYLPSLPLAPFGDGWVEITLLFRGCCHLLDKVFNQGFLLEISNQRFNVDYIFNGFSDEIADSRLDLSLVRS